MTWFALEENLQAVGLPVDLHRAAVELPAHKDIFPLAGQLLDAAAHLPNGGISADDPNAIEKLQAKLEKLEATQEMMKAVNAYYRAGGRRCQEAGLSYREIPGQPAFSAAGRSPPP